MKRFFIACLLGLCTLHVLTAQTFSATSAERPYQDLRDRAHKENNEGNSQDAYDLFQKFVFEPEVHTDSVVNDFNIMVQCLVQLNLDRETDALREKFAAAHPGKFRLLQAVADSYRGANHHGNIVAGEYKRGHHRGGGEYANSFERDRIRALQLMEQATALVEQQASPGQAASFYLTFASQVLTGRGQYGAWKLNALSDTSKLPDFENGYYYGWHHSDGTPGAPVDENGDPVFPRVPDSFASAQSDGERWRWLLERAKTLNEGFARNADWVFAEFLHQQFGVQTMAEHGWFFYGSRAQQADSGKDSSGTYQLHTLDRDETIAKLATGIKRFFLPEEFDFMRIYQAFADDPQSGYRESALNKLAEIFSNRRQYPESATYWDRSIEFHGPGNKGWKREKVSQIRSPWGQFEPVMTQPAGTGATVDYKYRNGSKARFTAHRIDVKALLDDVKTYLRKNPGNQVDWNRLQIGNLGYRLVHNKSAKYVGSEVASWSLKLDPAPRHYDRRITVTTPLQEAGAYLVTARMDDGNTCKIVLWVNDTIIVKKPLATNIKNHPADGPAYYFVADARTGVPVEKANVEFYGYWQESIKTTKGNPRYVVRTSTFAEYTDELGQVIPDRDDLIPDKNRNASWIVTATTPEGRFSHLGFSSVWMQDYYDHEYNQTKAYGITDRPVYRPNQSVQFKFWIRNAKYDEDSTSNYANDSFNVHIRNPKRDIVHEAAVQSDAFGGIEGTYEIPDDAPLGIYSLEVVGYGSSTFRIEEYKKPEFEVVVDNPTEPVMLGETIAATIRANYYFGAPVTEATVKYKVTRTAHSAQWYPPAPWDWFYGPGYWWFGYDYEWWPGWYGWGCRRPWPGWWPVQPDPPEIVAEAEVPVGEDGTVALRIDTSLAKEIHGDQDHQYTISAEVRDASRRTIVGTGEVLVAREPFKVYAWVDRGYYRVGDIVSASFTARTLDGRPVEGKGRLTLYQVTHDKERMPVETRVQEWDLDTNAEGAARQQITASAHGQYRVSYELTDAQGHRIEGGHVFVIRGEGFDGREFRFSQLELVPDKQSYRSGETVNLVINTDQPRGTVVLFIRPANGIYLKPKVLRLNGKSTVVPIEVSGKDMPNFFVEAFTVTGGNVYTELKEIVVPPEKRVLNVDVVPSQTEYKPGENASVEVRLTDHAGKPFHGSTVMTIYDKSVEYISGGTNVPEIKEFFWKWRRSHHPSTDDNAKRRETNQVPGGEKSMTALGVFGHSVASEIDELAAGIGGGRYREENGTKGFAGNVRMAAMSPALESKDEYEESPQALPETVEPKVRTEFADTAYWNAGLETDESGFATITFNMPENLTGWKIRAWGLGHGTRVGEGTAEAVTTKKLLLRLQAPRFFVQKDEVVLSANIHNYLDTEKRVRAVIELDGDTVELLSEATVDVTVDSNGEARVDWRVKVVKEGKIAVRMKALTDEESDAMQRSFPVYVHGMLKTESFSGVVRPDNAQGQICLTIPEEMRPEDSRLEVRFSPTLAGAMVDALPYLADYPYGCTEQTLNRFLPTVLTQKILLDMGIDLEAIKNKRTNLNAQEIGDAVERAHQWERFDRNPVFDEQEMIRMVKEGLKALNDMQLSDGGWGWFSGWREQSWPHTTAHVVHGLQLARENGVAIVPDTLSRSVNWLKKYQEGEIADIKADKRGKTRADNLDAFVFMVLVDEDIVSREMMEYLYRDRNRLAVYAKSMFAITLHKVGETDKRDMLVRNIEQYLVEDDENQTAYLNLPNSGYWWYWYGSEWEAHAYYLKLLARLDPTGKKASGLVKYLLNNRKHATYWNSTRDTAICIEAMAEYLRASGEDEPNMTVELLVDGQAKKEVRITKDNLFTFDNKLVIEDAGITSGDHTVEIRRSGKGPVYFNAYMTYFTLEDYITKAGLEIKVHRDYYRLNRVEKTQLVAGSRGQAIDQQVEKYERERLPDLSTVQSGDLIEIELVIESKNDYEYLVFEDMKPAGFEPVDVRSGYTDNAMRAYVEFRDERVAFFVSRLARGKHSVAYRMRAEIPGRFSALPTRGYAMYAPELKANSDEIKLVVVD